MISDNTRLATRIGADVKERLRSQAMVSPAEAEPDPD